jgi:hypothetical protein
MPSNKDRLYIALHVRGGAPIMLEKEDKYVQSNHHPPLLTRGHNSAVTRTGIPNFRTSLLTLLHWVGITGHL